MVSFRLGTGRQQSRWYDHCVSSAVLGALIRAKPSESFWAREWLDEVLRHNWRGYAEPAGSRAWAVGTVVGNETLVQSRPNVRDQDGRFLDDLLRTRAPCTLASYAWAGPVPGRDAPGVNVDLPRFQRWLGVMAERDLAAPGIDRRDAADQLAADLPSFLGRARNRNTDAELVLFAFLGALHGTGGLRGAFATPEQVRRALVELAERVASPINLFVYDGRTMGVLHGSGTLLAFDPPPPPEQGRRRSAVPEDGEARALANLLLWSPEDPSPTPVDGAERIAPGVFSVAPGRPRAIVRE